MSFIKIVMLDIWFGYKYYFIIKLNIIKSLVLKYFKAIKKNKSFIIVIISFYFNDIK